MSPLLLLTLLYSFGILMGHFLPVPDSCAMAAGVAGTATAILAVISKRMIFATVTSIFFLLGWCRPATGDSPGAVEAPFPCIRAVEGIVTSPPMMMEDQLRLTLEMERWSGCLSDPEIGLWRRTSGALYIWMKPSTPASVNRGERIRVRGNVRPMTPRRNPGMPQRDDERPAHTMALSTGDAVALRAALPLDIRSRFDLTRQDLAGFFRNTLSNEHAALARALSLGESAALSPVQRTAFQRTGCAHLLAVSGLHLGLGVLFVLFCMKWFLLRTPLAKRGDVGRIAALAALLFALAFTLLTGCRIPVVRACIMATSALLARALWKNAGTPEAVSLAALAILTWHPDALLEVGFQLSFASVLGFLLAFSRNDNERSVGSSPERRGDPTMRKFALGYLKKTALAATVAFAVTTPLVLYHFGYVAWLAVPVNLVAVPLTGFVILPLLFLVLGSALTAPALARFLCEPLAWLLDLLSGFLMRLAALPITLENPGPWLAGGISLLCLAVLLTLNGRRVTALGLLLLSGMFSLAGWFLDPPKIPPGKLTVDFLDVGQGDSSLLSFPTGERILVDAGGSSSYDVGAQVVVPALRALGVTRLDKVVITHPDLDHMGGIPAVLESMKVDELWDNGQGKTDESGAAYSRALRIAADRRIPILRPKRICGTHRIGAAALSVLHPCGDTLPIPRNAPANDHSIVILVTLESFSLLLTGDIPAQVEGQLVSMVPPRLDVLKLAHHGSRSASSEALLDATSPAYGIVSAAPFNRHHMPHFSVLRRFAKRGIRLYRTDQVGAIRVVTNGRVTEIGPSAR